MLSQRRSTDVQNLNLGGVLLYPSKSTSVAYRNTWSGVCDDLVKRCRSASEWRLYKGRGKVVVNRDGLIRERRLVRSRATVSKMSEAATKSEEH
jgi:hypothetical protein